MRPQLPHFVLIALIVTTYCLCLCLCQALIAAPPDGDPLFERDVRPILKANCFQCHGEDGSHKGELDLRLRHKILAGGESGETLVPGKPTESYLLEQIQTGAMPPGDKRLSKIEIDLISRWIASGAKVARVEPDSIDAGHYINAEEREFWSFQPIRRPVVPQIEPTELVTNPIDAFLLARLKKDGIGFSHQADRATLIRRATFDLIGLPPTPREIARFMKDRSPNAYERLIDRLLASPHYGERYGRHWLDVAGYADSEGYTEEDKTRQWAFRYRDYVIRAFNDDKPFDQFVHEQLGGDELIPVASRNLSPDQIEKLTATGFLRMAPDGTGSNGVDQETARNEVMASTLEIVSTSLLGLTVGCARCHTHRYDPISHADYHRLRAIFEPALDWKQWRTPQARQISLYTDADRKRAAEVEAEAVKVDEVRKNRTAFYIDRTLQEELQTLAADVRDALGSAYRAPAKDRTEAQKQLLKDYPSVASISAGSLYLYDRRRESRARQIDRDWLAKEALFVRSTSDAALAQLDDPTATSVRVARDTASNARTVEQTSLLKQHPAVAVTKSTLRKFNAAAADELAKDKQRAITLRKEKAADALKQLADQASAIRTGIPQQGFIRALTEPVNHAPETFVFLRGDHGQPRERIAPGVLSILQTTGMSMPSNDPLLPTTGRRLAYARHLTSPNHPLTARVLVNRIWSHHFGHGLVGSLGDFGYLGERPSHPELLDWLADEFMRGDWRLKRLHKQLMLSRAYRQTSRRTQALDLHDPDNRLYARMSVRRLETELIRDSILSIAGKLNEKMYGPPVPVMEDGIGQIVLGIESLDGERKPTAPVSLEGEQFRRSIYVQVRRSRTLSMLETFDAPTSAPNCVQRSVSNVAPQSLFLMNNDFVVQNAARFAERVRRDKPGSLREQVRYAWLLALGETPGREEIDASLQYLSRQTARRTEQPRTKTDASVYGEMHAMSTFCHALISTNRFLYID